MANVQTYLHSHADKALTEQHIADNMAFPFLREITHKYGLKVIGARGDNSFVINSYTKMILADEQGFPTSVIWMDKDTGAYNIRNTMQYKDRGRHWEDKFIYFGKRISSLMKTIDKEGLIPKNSEEFLNRTFGISLRSVTQKISSEYGNIEKNNRYFDGDEIHNLLQIVLNNRSIESLSKESIAKVKDTFDKYGQIDIMREKRVTEMASVFDKPMRVVMYDGLGFMVGKIKLDVTWGTHDMSCLNSSHGYIVENFKRINDVDECPELIPTLTMLKVMMQEARNDHTFVGDSGLFPTSYANNYTPELRVVGFNENSRWTRTGVVESDWLFIHE